LVIGLLTALVLWRGIGPRALALAAGVLLAGVVPLLYAILLPEDRGGFNSTYAADLIAAHWVALAACVLLALALWRTLVGARPGAVSTARGRSGGRAGEPAGAGAPAARP
ncbi:MAG TPA: hypothetical protein VEY90_08715, partial [Thermoleophilaceae bacterium]|nr:hypothetical protein [Thermoleophilaceae bacterium]